MSMAESWPTSASSRNDPEMAMKKKGIGMLLVLLPVLISLQGCAKNMEASCYGISKVDSPLGLRLSRAEVNVYDGSMTSVSIEETYSPSCWARLSEEDATKLGKDNVLQVEDCLNQDGSRSTVYFAKYIQVMGDTWYGSVRTDSEDDSFYRYNEYVQYSSLTNIDETATDLLRYLSVKDSTTYQLGSRVKSYFEDVLSGNNLIMRSKEGTDKKAVLEKTDVSPFYPSGKVKRSEGDSVWKQSVDALSSYLKGKKMNYRERVSDDDLDNYDTLKCKERTWYYNPQLASYDGQSKKTLESVSEKGYEKIDGCTLDGIDAVSLNSYFESVNKAFASVEYQSIS